MARRSLDDAAYVSRQAQVQTQAALPVPVSAAYSSLVLGLVGAMGAGYVVLAVLYLRERSRRSVALAYEAPVMAALLQQQQYADKPSVATV